MVTKNHTKYIRQLEQKKYRRREGLFVAEGIKVVGDLLQHFQPKTLPNIFKPVPNWQRPTMRLPKSPTKNSSASVSSSIPNRYWHYSPCPPQAMMPFARIASPSPSMVCRIQATSVPSSALPTGLASRTSTAARIQLMHGIRKSFRPRWAASLA